MRPADNPYWEDCSFDPETLEAMNTWPVRLVWNKSLAHYSDGDIALTVSVRTGRVEWRRKGKVHRDHDLPAVIEPDGSRTWGKNGFIQRDNDLPASITSGGVRAWMSRSSLHRDDGPALVAPNEGRSEWHQGGQPHRVGGPAYHDATGTRRWQLRGDFHRFDGPAHVSYGKPTVGLMEWIPGGIIRLIALKVTPPLPS